MSKELTTTKEVGELVSDLVLKGDLSKLSDNQKTLYYNSLCNSLDLNPLTRPFELLKLDGKEVMYATKSCTEQLRKIHNISIVDVSHNKISDVYVVTVKVSDGKRTDVATGAVSLQRMEMIWDNEQKRKVPTGRILDLKGDDLANAFMKAETKAKRRATLSICGLGILDESEIETIPNAQKVVSIQDAINELQEAESLEELATVWKKYKQFQKDPQFLEVKEWMKQSLQPVETLENE